MAADLPSYKDNAEAILFEPSWAGLYVGGQAGSLIGADNDLPYREGGVAGSGGSGGSAASGNSTPGNGGNGGDAHVVRGSGKIGDGVIGGHLGYNWQGGQFVYGMETDLDVVGGLDNLLGSVRGRVGVGSERILLYATAGLAYLSIDGRHSVAIAQGAGGGGGAGGAGGPGAPGQAGPTSQPGGVHYIDRPGVFETGFVAGGGLEYKLSPQVGVGVEGLYYTFDSNGLGQSFDSDFFSVRGRLTLHLNKGGSGAYGGMSGASVANWAGFYAGGHAGAAFDAASNTIDSVQGRNGEPGSSGGAADGDYAGGGGGGGGGGAIAAARLDDNGSFVGGGQIGYNWQNGAWVYGLEADLTFGDSAQHHLLTTGRGRLGYGVGALLFYGTAGVAYANAERYKAVTAGNGGDGQNGGDAVVLGGDGEGGSGGAGGVAYASKGSVDKVGYVVGGGVDAKVTDHIMLGFEGLYYGFDNKSGSGDFPANATTFAGADNSDVLVLRSRLSYQFSPSHEPLK